MKKMVEVEATFCDAPECQEQTHDFCACASCGTVFCFDHRKELAVSYPLSIYSSDDGHYCKPCDERLSRERIDPLHAAYQRVAALKAEGMAWREVYVFQADLAEAEVRRQKDRR